MSTDKSVRPADPADRYRNRKMVKSLINELNPKYAEQLKAVNTHLKVSQRKSRENTTAYLYFNYHLKDQLMWLRFTFYDSHIWCWTEGFNSQSRKTCIEWWKNHEPDGFSGILSEPKWVTLYREDFPPNANRTERYAKFREVVESNLPVWPAPLSRTTLYV